MSISFPYDRNYQPSAPVVEITIRRRGEMLLTALVDTGADACILPVDILTEIGAVYLETRQLYGITGHALSVNLYLLEVQIGPHRMPGIRAVAAKPGAEAILGRDVLNQLILTLDGIAGATEVS